MMTPFVDVLFYIFDDEIGFAILCFIDTLASKKARKKDLQGFPLHHFHCKCKHRW